MARRRLCISFDECSNFYDGLFHFMAKVLMEEEVDLCHEVLDRFEEGDESCTLKGRSWCEPEKENVVLRDVTESCQPT